MKDSHASDELDRLGSLIQSNITVQTSLDLTTGPAVSRNGPMNSNPNRQGGQEAAAARASRRWT